MDLIVDEIKTFNQGLEPVGVPYWLTSKERRQTQRAGTVIVAFKSEKEANTIIRHSISIAGLRLKAEKMLWTPRTSQSYKSTELCQYIKARCFNCGGKHTADSKDYETYLTIRNIRKES
ncbi:MAG: hypothetical protein FE78DRAFT_85333 [Acidomyces sp. 'richmondensis']|nr:MAG: hypothetical protein FE78DRAFT_85333 [Acidomyces sp. 'richmondensis']